jgi:hypothetical protein
MIKRDPAEGEEGQVLLVVAFAMAVLIGISALVIDLGFSWMLRRHEQNAADPAALAAARFISETDPATGMQTFDDVQGWEAACHYARENAFFSPANTDCDPELDGTSMTVNYPPDSTAGQFAGNPGYVQVVISSRHDTFFGRIWGQPYSTVTTQAVAARQRGNTNTNSLVALKPKGCGAATFHGDSTVTIYAVSGYSGPGGYVQVNSDCGNSTADDTCTTSSTGALTFNGGAQLTAPKVNVHGGCTGTSAEPTGVLDEASRQLGDPLGGLHFPPFTAETGASCGVGAAPTTRNGSEGCGGTGGRIAWSKSADSACPGLPSGYQCIELNPGIYYGGWDIGQKVRVTLKPGIYVIAGGGISIGSNGSLDSLAGGSAPAPILFYNTDNPKYAASCPGAGAEKCQGNINLTAKSNLELAGLKADTPCPPVSTTGGCPFGGMLIWFDGNGSMPVDNSTTGSTNCANYGCITISGGSILNISGTIYAPGAHVDIEGNVATNCDATSTQIAAVQIISWTWDIGGTGDVCMPYDPTKFYKRVQQGLVH